ncbi:MAG: polymerase III, delta prime subunit protein [Candidatus Azambacteria bacterium GW2011_GWA2_39_10]|uniref:Polymerase III, delta prime subunit protein n=1 Tax=Candidatus Azambacteria bacterium GW2011_GWA2_39_10 TaxID=1618611 RepID=A0A0G0PPX5_9BACT|nr:MAG: polymerase III, delta prime subunit protein [Candidatus Azambacteria bacterium GW2011_GWA2_39_10]
MNNYQKITDYLNKCIENNCLSHAYIFYGPDELAKKTIALKFANKILNPTFNFNPDLFLISADTDEERSINSIRQLKKFLILSPCYGKYKIAVIEAAEKLNIYAQNALLKIFEEAPNHAIIILNAKTIDSIPETIASRGVKLPFWRQTNIEQPVDEKIIEIFKEIISDESKDRYCIIEKFNDYSVIEIFKLWIVFLRAKFLFNPNQKLNNLLKTSQNIYFKLNETNINPKFAYDELILNLNMLIK